MINADRTLVAAACRARRRAACCRRARASRLPEQAYPHDRAVPAGRRVRRGGAPRRRGAVQAAVQQVVVENKPGATGNVAGQYVAQSEPDGYTIMLVYNGVLTINPFVFDKMPFDVTKDFTPIGKIGDYPFILTVNPAVEAKNLQELIALSKKTPKGLDYGTSGNGSNEHLIATLIVQKTGANLVHVPYKGGGPAMADAMAGHIPIGMASVAGGMALVKSGKLRPIVVSSAERWPSLPDVPTVVESGVPDVVVMSWIGLIGPAKIPRRRRRPAQCGAECVAQHPGDEGEDVRARRARHAGAARSLPKRDQEGLRPIRPGHQVGRHYCRAVTSTLGAFAMTGVVCDSARAPLIISDSQCTRSVV